MASNSSSKPPRRKAAFRPIALLCLPLLLLAQANSGHLKLGELPKVSGKRGAAVSATIPMAVDAGFHVNSNKPNEEYLIPLRLTWKSTGALEPGAVMFPKASEEKYEFTEKPLSIFTGKFAVIANFKVAANAPAGPGVAVGQLRYQACSDKMCFPPKNIEVALPYSIQ
jgi:cytochrome c biogenesis DsbD-like protein